MHTELLWLVTCFNCHHARQYSLDELDNDPTCEVCGAQLARVVRSEGFAAVYWRG